MVDVLDEQLRFGAVLADILRNKDEKEEARRIRKLFADKFEIPFEDITYDTPFAKGADGAMFRVEYEGDTMAAKVIGTAGIPAGMVAKKLQKFKKSIAIQASLLSSKTIAMRGACTTQPGKLIAVMEYAEQGSLQRILGDKSRDLSTAQKLSFLLDVPRLGAPPSNG